MGTPFISRFPVLDREQHLTGYELQLRSVGGEGGNESVRRPDTELLLESFQREELLRLSGGKSLLIPATPDLLARRKQLPLDPVYHILELSAEDLLAAGAQGAVDSWRQEGGRLAVEITDPGEDPERVGRRVDFYQVDISGFSHLNDL
ncbi:MAG TPA: hypothetical protein VKA48_05605, partial [Gammaproteobacteria bacterium]|nr:hypothetical protein [Gammaproteobacteria bacterium]